MNLCRTLEENHFNFFFSPIHTKFQPGGMPPRGPRGDWNRPPGNMQGFQGTNLLFSILIKIHLKKMKSNT